MENNRGWHQKLVLSIKERLGNKCSKCGFSDMRALQIDHIHGGGCKEKKKFGHQTTYYRYLRDLPDDKLKKDYQLLCANCNWIKRYENNELNTGEFGHKYEKGHPFYLGGEVGWIKKGEHLNPSTEFKKGNIPWNKKTGGGMPC